MKIVISGIKMKNYTIEIQNNYDGISELMYIYTK